MSERPQVRVRLVSWHEQAASLSHVRETVFVHEQGVPPELELDEHDAAAVHALAEDTEGRPVGAGRLLPDGHIGRLAVLSEMRGLGLGRVLLDTLVDTARQNGHEQAVLNAQVQALDFYLRAGFIVSSEPFMEAGIEHQEMRKPLQNG
ncbi:MAG: GNAT family N-acetyltransferase [Acidihalobacter sp.]|uniref:GNAT family N-acetyltransferase n=1 Tax=Acidihalobacter sp. TaxID=1872108 RepID=UPI00307EB748